MADILPPYYEDERMLSGLAYPLWPFVCPMVLMGVHREEPFVHFHALQALAAGAASLAAFFVAGLIAFLVLFLLPSSFVTFSGFVGLGIFLILAFAAFFWFTGIVYIAWQVSSGKFLRLPFIGRWAEDKMQADLGITSADYSPLMIGEKHEVRIDAFDYETALKKAAEDGDEYASSTPEAQGFVASELAGDPESIEYSRQESGDISSYLSGNEQETETAPDDGFKPLTGTQEPEADASGFRPLAGTSTGQGRAASQGSAAANGGFRPLAGTSAGQGRPAAQQAPAADASGFRPLTGTSGGQGRSSAQAAAADNSGFRPLAGTSAGQRRPSAQAAVADNSGFRPLTGTSVGQGRPAAQAPAADNSGFRPLAGTSAGQGRPSAQAPAADNSGFRPLAGTSVGQGRPSAQAPAADNSGFRPLAGTSAGQGRPSPQQAVRAPQRRAQVQVKAPAQSASFAPSRSSGRTAAQPAEQDFNPGIVSRQSPRR